MRRWAQETDAADKVINLIISMAREQEGLSTDPRSWRIVNLSESTQEQVGWMEQKT